MNTNPVVSFPVSKDLSQLAITNPTSYPSGAVHLAVKITSTGIDLAGSTDRVIGTLLSANMVPAQAGQSAVGMGADVFLKAGLVHFVQLGATSAAINSGDVLQIDAGNPGQFIPATSGSQTCIAYQGAAVTFQGAIIRAIV